MSNLATRILSSIAFVVLIIGPLIVLDKHYVYWLYALLGGFTLRELVALLKQTGTKISLPVSLMFYTLLAVLGYSIFFVGFSLKSIILLLAGSTLWIIISELFKTGAQPFERIAASLWMPCFVSISFLGVSYFFAYRDDLPSVELTISLFALIWINDSGAYLIGRKIGKTKLFERLSPNKTWEGSISGLVSALAASAGMSYISDMPHLGIMLGFGLTCIVFGSLGDLLESRLKRAANVKDSGRFLPGHGGFFDRFDAMILAVPAAILYFEIVYPK